MSRGLQGRLILSGPPDMTVKEVAEVTTGLNALPLVCKPTDTPGSFLLGYNSNEMAKRLLTHITENRVSVRQVQLTGKVLATKAEQDATVFIGNVPFNIEDNDLQAALSEIGPVVKMTVPKHPVFGTVLGFAFVTFKSPSHAEYLIRMKNFFPKALDFRWPLRASAPKSRRNPPTKGREPKASEAPASPTKILTKNGVMPVTQQQPTAAPSSKTPRKSGDLAATQQQPKAAWTTPKPSNENLENLTDSVTNAVEGLLNAFPRLSIENKKGILLKLLSKCVEQEHMPSVKPTPPVQTEDVAPKSKKKKKPTKNVTPPPKPHVVNPTAASSSTADEEMAEAEPTHAAKEQVSNNVEQQSPEDPQSKKKSQAKKGMELAETNLNDIENMRAIVTGGRISDGHVGITAREATILAAKIKQCGSNALRSFSVPFSMGVASQPKPGKIEIFPEAIAVLEEGSSIDISFRLPFENVINLKASNETIAIKINCSPLNLIPRKSARKPKLKNPPWFLIHTGAITGEIVSTLHCLFGLKNTQTDLLVFKEEPEDPIDVEVQTHDDRHPAKRSRQTVSWADIEAEDDPGFTSQGDVTMNTTPKQ